MFISRFAASRHAASNKFISLKTSLRAPIRSKSLKHPPRDDISGATTFVTSAETSGTDSPQPKVVYIDIVAKGQEHNSRRQGIHGSLSPANQELRDNIASGKVDPLQHLKSAIQTPLTNADIDTIRACVDGETKRLRFVTKSKRKSMRRAGFARFILQSLLEAEPKIWLSLFNNDTVSIGKLLSFALYEELEEIILGWITTVDFGQDASVEAKCFRNFLFRSLVQAHLFKDVNYSADDAIRCFFKVSDMSDAVRRSTRGKDNCLGRLSSWPASVTLASELGSGKYHGTSPQLFDRFFGFFEEYSTKKRGEEHRLARTYNLAAMQLAHPTSPDYTTALALLRELTTAMHHATAKEIQAWLPARLDNQRLFWRRVWQLAVRNGHEEDAAFVDDISQKLYGRSFVNVSPSNRPARPKASKDRWGTLSIRPGKRTSE